MLKYRLAREPGSTYTIEGTAAGDARRAVRWVRAHAAEYGIDPHRIGAVGYSSGAHLAALLGVLDATEDADDPDPVNRVSARVQCVVAAATPAGQDEWGRAPGGELRQPGWPRREAAPVAR